MRYWMIMVLAVVLAGCGSQTRGGVTQGDPPTAPTASVQYNFVLARAVPAAIDSFEFSGLDSGGNLSFGPVARNKTAVVELSGIPLHVRTMRALYFQAGILVGLGDTSVLLSSNGKNTINDPNFVDVTVASLAILPNGPLNLNIGATQELAVTVTLSNMEQFGVTNQATYVSSAPAVATVSATGLVTAVGNGTTTITATYSGVNQTIVINVP